MICMGIESQDSDLRSRKLMEIGFLKREIENLNNERRHAKSEMQSQAFQQQIRVKEARLQELLKDLQHP